MNDPADEFQEMLAAKMKLVAEAKLRGPAGPLAVPLTVPPMFLQANTASDAVADEAAPALWIAGYPSLVGGADTELWHMIRLWRANGLAVHLVPSGEPSDMMRQMVESVGAMTHRYSRGIFAGKTVASWCNGWFLDNLPDIIADGRPARVIWANCMTWLFPKELQAHRNGWIDLFLFQSEYQRAILRPQLEEVGPVHELAGFRAYFDADEPLQGFTFAYREPVDHFAIGRISRSDPSKFAADTWQTFDAIRERSPRPVKAYILGYSDQVEAKLGNPPETLDYMHWTAGAVPAASVLNRLHCLVHHTGGSRENWPRTVLEAMASGVPVVAERAYGLPEMIEDGVSGYLCDSSQQMVERVVELASDEPKRQAMIYAARERLQELADARTCWQPWQQLMNTPAPRRVNLGVVDDDVAQDRRQACIVCGATEVGELTGKCPKIGGGTCARCVMPYQTARADRCPLFGRGGWTE